MTLVEALPAPLASVLGEDVGRWLMGMHSEEGVDVRLSTKLEGARGNGTVEELRLGGGGTLECDTVVVGIGVDSHRGLARGQPSGSGWRDHRPAGRAAVPDVFAAGDVARRFDLRVGEHRRSEHWDAAARQGAAAARAMLGEQSEPGPAPSFWSDQYGLRIQYTGYADLSDETTVEGRPEERCFSVTYTREGRPVGALAVNDPRAYARLRREVETTFDKENREKERP